MKTRLTRHLKCHPEDQVGYINVTNSESFQRFGLQQMSSPGPQAKLDRRYFLKVMPDEVLQRKEVVGQVGTLHGIKTKFQYICQTDGEVICDNHLIFEINS